MISKPQEQYASKTVSMICEANEDYFKNTTCLLKPINRYVSHVNGDADLVKTLTNYECTIQFFSCYNGCHPYFTNLTFDMCDFNGKSKHLYANTIYRSIQKNETNVLKPCPLLPVTISFFDF